MNNFDAYLDDFSLITILIRKEIYSKSLKFTLEGNEEVIELNIKEIIDIGDRIKLIANFDYCLILTDNYFVVSSNNYRTILKSGKITRSPLFDTLYFYKKDDLGVNYREESNTTCFKLWAPVLKDSKLELIDKNGKVNLYDMKPYKHGIYRVDLNGKYFGCKYRYVVNINEKTTYIADPYSISSSPNGEYSYIVDKNKFYQMKYKLDNKEEFKNPIIYEVSLKDFTSYFNINEKSSYLGFIKKGLKNNYNKKAGFDYLKELGVNVIQIMPTFLFGAVDELNKDSFYNWGYNPVLYNVPSGMYSLDVNNPYTRINELKRMIDSIHKEGFRVVLDVVYNHVYDPINYPSEVVTPGYTFRYNEFGIKTEISGCKNDVDTSKLMNRNFIINSLKYILTEYNVDGFRFDLMGLIDAKTMNILKEELTSINSDILLYGEGWNMLESNYELGLANMYNKNVDNEIGFFNDKFRDTVKKYILSMNINKDDLIDVIKGSKSLFSFPHQSINYLECHDNYTLYDYLKKELDNENDSIIKNRIILGISIILLSNGVPFMHTLMEALRTKNGVRDSYNLNDGTNDVDWNLITENKEIVDRTKELIKIRKEFKVFSIDDYETINKIENIQINKNNTVKINYNNELYVIFKNTKEVEKIDLIDYNILSSNLNIKNNIIDDIGYVVLKR